MKHNMVDLQVPVYFRHALRCYFHVLCTDELSQCLFTLKDPHLQNGKNQLVAKIGVFVKINHSSNDPCPYYWQSFEILPF